MKELNDKLYRKWTWNCYRDSMCKSTWPWHIKGERFSVSCPSLYKFKFDSYSAQGRLDIARSIIEGELKPSADMLDSVYNCNLCGACDYICGRIKEQNPGLVIQATRAELVKKGIGPTEAFKPLLKNIEDTNNPYGKANSARNEWVKGISAGKTTGKAAAKNTTVLYVGCNVMKNPEFHKLPQNAVKILQKAGMDVGILGDKEKCCGNPSRRIGDVDQFVALAKENIKNFNDMGVKKVICTCAECYGTLKRDYAELGIKMNFEVVHIVEVIDQLIKEGKLKIRKPVNMKVTWHDPCHLGRLSYSGVIGTGSFGVYQAPRDILKAVGATLVEMERATDDAFCCGNGSWMLTGNPEFAQWAANERLTEAKASTAEALVTCCPHCDENLNQALQSEGESIKLFDLLEIVAQAI